ncbi:MAG: AI-2E family transporter [Opitutaceae bacterium]|nr:AI-2E family transporter [Opitutaceae bacterium]
MNNDRETTTPSPVPATNDWGAPGHVRTLVLMAATVGGVYLCYRLALPFLGALAWALALAVVFTPFQRWVESIVRSPNWAAVVSVFIIGVVVIGLVWLVGQRLVVEAANGAAAITETIDSGEWKQTLDAHPRLVPLADWMVRQDLPEAVKTAATWLTTNGAALVKGSVLQAIELLVTFYLLFFFLRDRRSALRLLRSLSPMSPVQMDRLFGRVDDTIYATIYGTLAVSAVQGLLGGLMFWWLGLPAPLLWGVVMGLLAVVPVLGAFVVWVPAALYLAMNGSWGKALLLALWGCAVVGTIDNLLYPMFVGKRLKLHTVLTFISAVGGLIVFGPAGLIFGPVVLTVTIELLDIWRCRPTVTEPASADLAALSRFESEGGPEGPVAR